MTPETGKKFAYLICFAVISVAVVGYFVGLQSPMNPGEIIGTEYHQPVPDLAAIAHDVAAQTPLTLTSVIPATHYSEMSVATKQRAAGITTSIADLKMAPVDLLTEIKILPADKTFALQMREQNRAFNGAPPTIPHPIDQQSSQACAACHTNGISTETLRLPRMSHQFLENCTQCHVENSPQHQVATTFRENGFVGLAAPTAGPRAFAGAPPQIPHSTWMRVDCMSCHGLAGLQGIRTTHPWRQNCQQCHAPSSELDQIQLEAAPKFLEPMKIK